MKKLIGIFLLLLILLYGCSKSSLEIDKSIISNGEKSTEITIISKEDNSEVSLNLNYLIWERTGKEGATWSNYFEEKHGIKINLNYVNQIGPVQAIENELGGIIYLNNYFGNRYNTEINIVLNDKVNELYDLTEYYEQYNLYEFIDSKLIKTVSIADNIYAIPVSSEERVYPRYYRKETIDRIGCSIPSSISELTDYLRTAKKLDNEFYPMFINVGTMTHCSADIFRAFDVYVNTNEESMITLNPKTNSYEDAVFSGNFNQVYTYLEMLQEENLLLLYHPIKDREMIIPKDIKLATEYNCIYSNLYNYPELIPEYEYYSGYYLEGINYEKLVEVRKDVVYYLFPKSIKNIDNTMQNFYSVFTDSTYTNDLLYGIEGVDYDVINEIINYNSKLNIRQINQPYSIDKLGDETQNDYLEYDSRMKYEASTPFDILTFGKALDDVYPGYANFAKYVASTAVMELFHNDLNCEEAILIYKTEFNKYNIKGFIDELNKKINVTTQYDYN